MLILFFIMIFISIAGLFSGCFLLWNLPYIPTKIKKRSLNSSLSIVIPARNEAGNLSKVLSSIKKQSVQPYEIIVVDDQSTDETVQVAQEFTVTISKTDLYNEDGSHKTGKSAACWVGAKQSKGEWILFLDADTSFETEDSLERICETFSSKKQSSGLLSIQPYHKIRSVYETFSIVFNILVLAGMNRFSLLRNRLPERGAFGPFLLCTREQYFQVGGHRKIVDSHMDDIELAKLFQKMEFPVFTYGGKGSVAFRMFPDGFTQLVLGWSKSIIHGAVGTHPVVWAAIILWINAGLFTPILLVLSFYSNSIYIISVSVGLIVAYGCGFAWLADKVGEFPTWSFFLYPIFILGFLLLFTGSLIQVYFFRAVYWRGRKIEL